MEIRSAEEIVRHGHSVRPNMLRSEYFRTRWVSADSLLHELNVHQKDYPILTSILKKELELE